LLIYVEPHGALPQARARSCRKGANDPVKASWVMSIVALSVVVCGPWTSAQQQSGQQPGARPAPAQVRATEGAGSTIFGDYCENCHRPTLLPEGRTPISTVAFVLRLSITRQPWRAGTGCY